MPVIGYLHVGSSAESRDRVSAFHRGLKELGFVEGRDVAIEYRWADNQFDRLPELASDLIRRGVAIIAAPAGADTARVVKALTTTIPIVQHRRGPGRNWLGPKPQPAGGQCDRCR
jgi:putative ABC transport system substrate-binding protein